MTRPVRLQIYISHELSARIREAARASDLSVSAWAMARLSAACDDEVSPSDTGFLVERIARQSVFAMIGIDALLAGHPDPHLRERAHQAYARKCGELGLARSSEKPEES
ncbi:MAG: hypothetical protein JSS55_11700 [Proteobacteria bacterium]|nr:hypothetical protein [Pseudomonadota bacterium]